MNDAPSPLKFGFPNAERYGRSGEGMFLTELLQSLGWERVFSGAEWDLLWYSRPDPSPGAYRQLRVHQRINHMPGIEALASKADLYRTLAAFARRLSDAGRGPGPRFFPKTYMLESQWHVFAVEAARHPDRKWILKPANGSWGRNIRVVSDANAVPRSGPWLVQEYIDNPLTHLGRKHNLRVFVLITSADPLEVFLHRDGYVDLATEPYSLDPDKLDDPYVHNTNSGVQLARPGIKPEDCWLDLAGWRRNLRAGGIDDAILWDACRELIVKTVASAREPLRKPARELLPHPRNCFELLGLDLMIDSGLEPWLIECNRSPSLTTSQSREIKVKLIRDLLGVLGFADGARPGLPDKPAAEMAYGGFECIFPGPEPDRYKDYLDPFD